jgi:hypothetical protein
MYLYIFEDGSLGQSQQAPTATDMECIGDGVLQVITLVGGRFVDTNRDSAAQGRVRFDDIAEVNQAKGFSE